MSVLFQSDWYNENRKPRAIVQTTTKNLSFRRMAVVLRKMGIKNHLFHLCLYDPKLLGVDPHKLNFDTDPTGELRLRVAAECKRNVWYYLREVLRIPVDGSDPVPFKLDRGNLAMTWCYNVHIDYNGTQPRQTGKSQPLYSKIRIPGGWTTMGKIHLNDPVIAADGSTVNVIGIYPQGLRDIYKVTFVDGRHTECCDEHLWKVYHQGQWCVLPLSEIQHRLSSSEPHNRMYIPLIIPEDKSDIPLPSDPYQVGKLVAHDIYPSTIPYMYCNASVVQKRALLNGILDTLPQGRDNGSYVLKTLYKSTAASVDALVKSLGGLCHIVEPRDASGIYHVIIVVTCLDGSPLHGLQIKSIEYVGQRESQCIEIDHPDHLYVTDDYIVTHNTIGAISLASWTVYIAGWRMSLGMVTHSATLVQANVKRLKGMRDGLPEYLIFSDADGLDTDNKQGLDYKSLKTAYETYIGQKDRNAANRVGRGTSAPALHFDEIGFIPNIRITFPAIMATTNKARPNAKAAGQPHSNIYTTTAADPQTEEGAYAFELVTMAMPFTEKLYDCANEEAAHAMVKANSTNGLVNGTFSYLQLGYSHEWFRTTIARNNVPPDEVERDYLNHWISAAKYPILSKDLLARMNASKVEPHHCEIFGNYVINWYVPKEVSGSPAFRNSCMVMGMDSSEAIGRDFTTFVCIDPRTLRVLFTFRCNDSNTTKIALFVAQLLLDFPKMVFVPERKSTGATIIDTVVMVLARERQNPFLRIFNQIVDRKDNKEYAHYDLHDPDLMDSTARKHLGFMTTQTSRGFLYKQVLQRAGELAADKVYDITLVTEIAGLQAINGRIDHKTGHHDDMVIAFLLACYLVLEGKNLHYYGLSTSDILPNTVTSATSGHDQKYIDSQLMLRAQMQELDTQMRAATHETVRAHFRYKLSQLQHHVDPTLQIEPSSVETVRRERVQFKPISDAPLKNPPVSISDFFSVAHF